MARRSKASGLRSGRPRLPLYPCCSQTPSRDPTSQDDMADKYTPHSGAKQPDATNLADTRQHSEHNKIVWNTDIFKRIVEPSHDIMHFFEHFVPI